MALQALHEYYWPGDGVEGGAAATSAYHNWQVVVLYCGIPVKLPRWFVRWVLWAWTMFYRWCVPERLYLFCRLLRLLWSYDFQRARVAVRIVAQMPNMANKRAWGAIGYRIGQQASVGENVFRHLAATEEYGATPHKEFHERNTLLELAWLALKERRH